MPDYGYSLEMPHELLRLADPKQPLQDDVVSEGYEPSIHADVAEEIPVGVKDGEPLARQSNGALG